MSLLRWMDSAVEHGMFFDLTSEGIVGSRENNDMYEMYFLDTQSREQLLYFEIHVEEKFQKLFKEMEWSNAFVTKYISVISKKPAFYLKCNIHGYTCQYHFYVDEEVSVYLWIRNEKSRIVYLEELPKQVLSDIKKLHYYVESYIRHYISTDIVIESQLSNLLRRTPKEE
ncbi:hypothetical protein CN918_25330 [Priestia megaterium]|nr:hypothetical protein CN918_25330 [Priestia megaterium]